ncbi:AlpA family transcriptional regulator [Asticcacaulis sp.]|uniref:helix-turn-helix transcriptional regulator n=1 Tax=Asticcacaulis sp. TaxID=1872648 RepID=UPI002605EFED|nr:AlpA family transcriptional regulator [Asticcacaulis sp.]
MTNLSAGEISKSRGPTATRIVRLAEVRALTGLSRSTVYERIRDGQFPKSVDLGGRCVGWLESEVLA